MNIVEAATRPRHWRSLLRTRAHQVCDHCFQASLLLILSASLAIYAGNSPVTGEFPSHRPMTRSFDVFFICAWMNGWINNGEADDLRRHCAHYDIIVMTYCFYWHGITQIRPWIRGYIHTCLQDVINRHCLNVSPLDKMSDISQVILHFRE